MNRYQHAQEQWHPRMLFKPSEDRGYPQLWIIEENGENGKSWGELFSWSRTKGQEFCEQRTLPIPLRTREVES